MRKHEIVGKDWTVVDVVTQFCRKFHLGYGQGINIDYVEENDTTVKVRARIISWPSFSYIDVELWKNPELKIWQAFGELRVYIPKLTSINDHEVITCGFTGNFARFNVEPDLSDYKFTAIYGYDGQCHCPQTEENLNLSF